MILTALLASFLNVALFHDIHISYSTSELSGGQYRGTLSYYKDDFEKAVSKWYKREVSTMAQAERDNAMKNYVRNYFRVWERDVKIEMTKLDTKEEESTITYSFAFPVSSGCTELKIDHRAMFDVYNDHINIMSFTAFGGEYNYIFKASAPTYILKK